MGLDDRLLNDFRGLERTLTGNGYLPFAKVDGFVLYHLYNKDDHFNVPGRYFAFRENESVSNKVGNAIFWKADYPENAIKSLENLPIYHSKNAGGDARARAFYSLLTAGLSAAGTYVLTRNGIFTFLAFFIGAGTYLVGNVLLSETSYLLALESAKKRFDGRLEGKRAVQEVLAWTEITRVNA